MVVPRLRTVPPLAARCSAPADFASLRVLGAPAASRPPLLTSSLVALPASLGSSYRPALRWPGIPGLRSASRCSSIQHGRPTSSHRAAFSGPVFRPCGLRFAPCPRGSSRFAASAAHKLACGTPCFIGLTTACFAHCARLPCAPRPSTPSGLRRLRPVSRTARGLRAPRLRRPSVPALRTALAFGGAVFRRCGRLLGVSSRLQPLRGLCLRTACARASSRFAASNGQRPGQECIFTHSSQSSIHIARKACLWLSLLTGLTSACFRHRRRPPCASSIRNGRPAAPDGLQYSLAHWAYFGLFRALRAAFVRPAKNARNDVHAVISDLNLVLSILCQGSERGSSLKQMPAFFALRWDCERTTIVFRRPAFVKGGYKAK